VRIHRPHPQAYRELRTAGLCRCGEVPWSVDAFFVGGGDGGGRYRGNGADAEAKAGYSSELVVAVFWFHGLAFRVLDLGSGFARLALRV
jgi:hypothetical protein